MIERIKTLLEQKKTLKGWKIDEKVIDSYQLFFIKQELDMNRSVETKEYLVTLYKEHKVKQEIMQGEYTTTLTPNMSDAEINEKLDEAEELTCLSLNRPYNLVSKQPERGNDKEVSFAGHTLKEAAFLLADIVFETNTYASGYLNSTEIFVNFEKRHFLNSLGHEFVYAKSYAQLDVVVTWLEENKNADNEEIELHQFFEFDSLNQTYIKGVINNLFEEAKNRFKATNHIPMDKNCKVILKNDALKEIFTFFANKVKVDNIFNRYSDYRIGDYIQKNNDLSDKLTISLEPLLPGSSKNALYDEDGITLRSIRIIDKGKVCNVWGSAQKAQYMKLPNNGQFSNLVVECGLAKMEELVKENYLEIVSLSDMSVDLLTGDFGSEIRFAYYHTKKGEIIPITGGSIVGNAIECIQNVRLSDESQQLNNIKMPKFAIFDKISIAK